MLVPRIVVVGSVNVDMVVKGRRLPGPGETVTGGQFVMAAGGKGANQAVAAARLGAQVTLVARVGADVFGDQSLENFRRENIATDFILRDSRRATGVALILVDEAGENSISVAAGANAALTPADVDMAAAAIRQADVLMLQLEIPMDTVCHAARIAAEAAVPVILDPAPAVPLPESLWKNVAYVTPNETEAELLVGIRVRDEATAREAAARLTAHGAQHAMITLGARGALVADADGMTLVPSRPVDAVDTTAAGDAFNGGLAWALGTGLSLREAVRRACLVGALSATRLGAQPSLPTHEELAQFSQR
ncbi:MAG: ribokinase [Thermoguttaceae bacterium]